MRVRAALLLLVLAGCAQQGGPPPRYLVGSPYQLAGTWSYPREDFALVQTGLASVAATPDGRRTANGESWDASAMMAAHRTLQLPAVVRVTNLENGLETEVRVNDRGPANPGRVIDLSRRAAELLQIRGAAQVRIAVVPEASRALAGNLPNPEAPRVQVAAAPVGAVMREDLAPPPGASQAASVRQARPLPSAGPAAAAAGPAASAVPDRLPERVTRGAPQPGRLFIETATFSTRALADQQAARVGGGVEAFGPPGRQSFRVRIGPLQNVTEADRTLERTLRAGVSEARILVE
ncbi:septal ring lytic transglycosylase RlpA family protein [Falsiroseomonas sp. HW251]|uniref:septal ring lytic transglycosylase RlpA family protein n=1 Tax=Falsiroseomonas sp. HW251 TaxID=3390998 RepID=UPI003D31D7CB